MVVLAHEAKLSTKEEETSRNARFSRPLTDKVWSTSPLATYAQRSRISLRLMPASYRLSRADFTTLKVLTRIHGELFSYSIASLPSRTTPGGACIVSTKVARSAVKRNFIKRAARIALSSLFEKAAPIVVLCHAKKTAKNASAKDIRAEIEGLRKRVVRM